MRNRRLDSSGVAERALPFDERPADDSCFTRVAYAKMLDAALASEYRFLGYAEATASLEAERACILRHDIDIDPGAACELAEIEAARGIRATFFVMLRSPAYNAFGRANQTLLRRIAGRGHSIGLHFDLAFRPDSRSEEEWIEAEAAILEQLLGVRIDTISFHQPSLGERDAREIRPARLLSAYDFPGFTYVSDANKTLGQGSLIRLFEEATLPRIQLCIHPVWWATDDPHATVEELWDDAILANLYRSQEQILETERGFGTRRRWNVERDE